MKFNNKWLKEIVDEAWSEENPLEYVEDTGWVGDGGKYEYKETIFKFESKYYLISESRSGSYYSDYYYETEDWSDDGEQDCNEVKKVVVEKYEWVPVKS
jgi:DNA repair protein SbcC/Rad50